MEESLYGRVYIPTEELHDASQGISWETFEKNCSSEE